jgi:hypothetical protein
MEAWVFDMGMCMPIPMKDMSMTMLMVSGNAFAAYVSEQGPRGRRDFAAPNMFMVDLGTSLGDRHYVNLDFMGTLEKWTFPRAGYPELLQVGEHDENGVPFVDAQHPHSSPVMGLTLSDTIALGAGKDHLRVFFAPRGPSTDGPIAFMHRPTGMVNPDAPLGHHIGQDAGHISSTVLGGALRLGSTEIQASAFHGEEPEPTKVDLPIGSPNSYSARLIQAFSPSVYAVASGSYVKDPEGHDTSTPFVVRYSGSLYSRSRLGDEWNLYNTFIYGQIRNYDQGGTLASFGEEFRFSRERQDIWGRAEALQRTAAQLAIPSADPDQGRWVTAVTLGYTHGIFRTSSTQVGLGGSVTKDFLPGEFQAAYGGNPWTGKLFIQLSGMGMWDLGNR